jgi:hypothetical protein
LSEQVTQAAWAIPANNPTIAKTVTIATIIALFFIFPSSSFFYFQVIRPEIFGILSCF